MMWEELSPVVEKQLRWLPPPNFLAIQLGSNDLESRSNLGFIKDIEIDILHLHALMPHTKIVWIDMSQRRYWHTANCGKAIEKTRKRVNFEVRHTVGSIQGFTIRHVNIKAKEIDLYRRDGTHLSDVGLSVCLNNIQGAFESFLKTGGPSDFPRLNSGIVRDMA